jgi:hypothetical protein
MPITQTVIRCAVFINSKDNFTEVFTGATPQAWKSTDIVFQLAFFKGTKKSPVLVTAEELADLAKISLEVFPATRTGAAYMNNFVLLEDFDTTLDATTWADGSKQHVSIPFTFAENNLPIPDGATEADFWLVVSGVSNTVPIQYPTLGATQFKQIRDAVLDETDAPVQAGNIIPEGATYDGAGHYILATTTDRTYSYAQGANDTSITNGAQTVDADGLFTALGVSVTLNGTAGQLVTAVIRPDVFITADQADARYFNKNGLESRIPIQADDGSTCYIRVRIIDGVRTLSIEDA